MPLNNNGVQQVLDRFSSSFSSLFLLLVQFVLRIWVAILIWAKLMHTQTHTHTLNYHPVDRLKWKVKENLFALRFAFLVFFRFSSKPRTNARISFFSSISSPASLSSKPKAHGTFNFNAKFILFDCALHHSRRRMWNWKLLLLLMLLRIIVVLVFRAQARNKHWIKAIRQKYWIRIWIRCKT